MTAVIDCESRLGLDDGELAPVPIHSSDLALSPTSSDDSVAADRVARAVTTRRLREHVGNVLGVIGACLVMAGVGLVLMHVMDVLSPQCIVDAQGSCEALPDLTVPGVVAAVIGLTLVVAAGLRALRQ